jgi:hypothetical protein
VLDSLDAVKDLPQLLADEYKGSGPEPANVLHLAINEGIEDGAGATEELISAVQDTFQSCKADLDAKGVRLISLMVPNPPARPRQFSFLASDNFMEAPERRNMIPTMYNLLELKRLSNWSPEYLPSISHNTVVLLGSQGTKPRVQQRLFVRGLTHSSSLLDLGSIELTL